LAIILGGDFLNTLAYLVSILVDFGGNKGQAEDPEEQVAEANEGIG
jgi:hypothetical protein